MQDELWNAIISCDHRYDGHFFYGVLTTGIFCRPSCKSKIPKREHVRIFFSAIEAQAAGLRPCKRCRPDDHEWHGSDEELVDRAKKLIETCFHESLTLNKLATKLYVSPYYFHRKFRRMTGRTPAEYLLDRRLEAAKALLAETDLTVKEIAFNVGFQSVAHFSSVFRRAIGVSPKEFRCGGSNFK